MKISPNYSYNHICCFCHKNIATKDKETSRNLYYVEKASHYFGVYHSARYHKITVRVPMCRECGKIDRKISLICLSIGVFIFIISTYALSGVFAESDCNPTRSIENIFIACLPSIIIVYFVGGAIAFVIRIWLERKWNFNDCAAYPPIKKLVSIGFELRDSLPNIKNDEIQGNGPLEMNELREAIAWIIMNEHCDFEN